MDSVLLADFATLQNRTRVCDLGTGTGIIPLLLYGRNNTLQLDAVEIQPSSAERASRSMRMNQAAEHIQVHQADLRQIKTLLPHAQYALVTCNPPYKTGGTGILSAETAHQIARHEVLCGIDDVCAAAASLLKTGGRLCICQRPERLADIIIAMRAHRIEPKRLQFVAKNDRTNPWLLLIEGKKDAKPYMDVLPTLIFDKETAAAITGYGSK